MDTSVVDILVNKVSKDWERFARCSEFTDDLSVNAIIEYINEDDKTDDSKWKMKCLLKKLFEHHPKDYKLYIKISLINMKRNDVLQDLSILEMDTSVVNILVNKVSKDWERFARCSEFTDDLSVNAIIEYINEDDKTDDSKWKMKCLLKKLFEHHPKDYKVYIEKSLINMKRNDVLQDLSILGNYGSWSGWGACSETCQSNPTMSPFQTQTRQCIGATFNGGCYGASSQIRTCHSGVSCPDVSNISVALKEKYIQTYEEIDELQPRQNTSASVALLNKFIELCIVNSIDVNADVVYRVERSNFLKKQMNYKPIPYNKVFSDEKSLLLVSGIAGIGKSWLLRKCLLDWANNRIWEKVDFVFYFECRMLNKYLNISNITELLNFFYKDFTKDFNINNHNVIFIIDGLDEFKYLDDLINYTSCSQYPIVDTLFEIQKYKSVVAGRVYAIDQYKSIQTSKMHNKKLIIQIMGFNDNGIYNYIENNVIEDKKEDVKTILNNNSIAKAMASVPFYLSSMCKIIVESKEKDYSFLTMTDLYASICLYFLKNHINKNGVPVYKMMENDLFKQYFLIICKIAYKLFVENKIIFSKEEIQMIISDFDEVEDRLFGFIERIETDLGYLYQFAHLTIMEFCASVYAYNNFSGKEIVANTNLENCLSMICGLTNKSPNSLIKFLEKLNNTNKEKISITHICDIPYSSGNPWSDLVSDRKAYRNFDNESFIECFYESQSSFDEIKSFVDTKNWVIIIEDRKTSYETSCENYFINQFIKSGRKLCTLSVHKSILSDEEKHLIMTCSTNVHDVNFSRAINIEGWKPKDQIAELGIGISRYLMSKKEFENFLPWFNVCKELHLVLHYNNDYIEDIYEWIRCSNIKKLKIEYRANYFNNLDKFKNFITRNDV